jgi:hypothetical protein
LIVGFGENSLALKDTLLPLEFLYCGRSEWDY